jgi:hypothetical protein
MELRKSHRNANLLVSKCGRLFYEDDGRPLQITVVHGCSCRGPVATYRNKKARKTKLISVATEVLETWVIERKTMKCDYVYFKDNNSDNCHASNITLKGSPGRLRTEPIPHDERYEIYMWNGDGALYC